MRNSRNREEGTNIERERETERQREKDRDRDREEEVAHSLQEAHSRQKVYILVRRGVYVKKKDYHQEDFNDLYNSN